MPERSDGVFRCPKCFQKYDVPTTSVAVIVGHMGRHGIVVDRRWVRRRLKEQVTQ